MADWIALTLPDGTLHTFQVCWISKFGPISPHLASSWISKFGPISPHLASSAWASGSIQIGADSANGILVKESADQIAALIGLRGARGRE